ncbi:GH36-type glycosyl hydrolase domain-containing protein [Roseateles sp. NT4]|uniref:GH36-type glycosyl hydrolase domain-containing protein n=1 Tax=Roseateles sp. NT4 TaxID=3453715 RepID=UPI003EEDC3EC
MTAHLIRNAAGLEAELLSHGALRRLLLAPGLMLNLFPGNELEGGPANVWLRRRESAGAWRITPLLGPLSPLSVFADEDGFEMRGEWEGLALRLSLRLAADEPVLFWHLQAANLGEAPCEISPVLVQDVGLADYGAVRTNEFYVSHYIDLQPLQHASHGTLLAVRQNQSQGGKHPWLLAGSLHRAESFATDAGQVWGLAAREGALPPGLLNDLPGRRLQHEHAVVALQDEPRTLAPGERVAAGFFLALQAHHPEASSAADLDRLAALLALAEAQPAKMVDAPGLAPAASLFASAPMLASRDLGDEDLDAWLPGERRHEEWQGDQRLSFFSGEASHIVLRAKELIVQRPHGHILRSGEHLVPDEGALTSTCWMGGVFHSMLTQGHVSINRLLSTQRSLLGLFGTAGLRLFVQPQLSDWQLLGLPSAFEMQPQRCRWIYAFDAGVIEVVASAGAAPEAMELSLRLLKGRALRLRASLNLAVGGDDGAATLKPVWEHSGERLRITPPEGSELAERFPGGGLVIEAPGVAIVGDDGRLYNDGVSRGDPIVCLDFAAATAFTMTLRGELLEAAPPSAEPLTLPQWQHPALAQLRDILPWYAHNALVHYLSPRGLEQYSGGGWGTRDVCQGPLEMLLALGRTEPVRDLLLRVFANQNPDGDWPQWFMFFEREAKIRAGDSHGDIVFWPLLGLAQYLIASGDAGLLDEVVPFHGGEPATLAAHVEQALALIRQRVVPGTGLAAYWHGDWNDSLQPADPALRERLCSAWTVTLHHQMLHTLATAFSQLGRSDQATALAAEAMGVRAEFQRLLVQDNVVAGYALFPEQGERELWIHPQDTRTGLRYSLLPMMHAVIDELFTPEQAATQAALIEQHLKGPDGARLFDAPLPYLGGPSTLFQRAETSSFFGREIGIMYMHAHLRYAQMLAHLGHAEAFLKALMLAHPIALTDRVPSASRRQANCYYSSSDAAFPDRYVAQAEYGRALAGEVALDGGWRIYSSGPGIALGLVIHSLLGLRLEQGALVVDPVMPAVLDGLTVQLVLADLRFELSYRVGPRGHGVERVRDESGQELAATRRPHAYRLGALALTRPAPGGVHRWTIELG